MSMVRKIDTAIEAIVTGTAQSYTINGRVYTALNINDLYSLRDKYKAEEAFARRGTRVGKIGFVRMR